MNFWNLVFSICMFSVGIANFVLLSLIVSSKLPRHKQQNDVTPPKTKPKKEKKKPEEKRKQRSKHKDPFYDELLNPTEKT